MTLPGFRLTEIPLYAILLLREKLMNSVFKLSRKGSGAAAAERE
jgi:hypothetical protein